MCSLHNLISDKLSLVRFQIISPFIWFSCYNKNNGVKYNGNVRSRIWIPCRHPFCEGTVRDRRISKNKNCIACNCPPRFFLKSNEWLRTAGVKNIDNVHMTKSPVIFNAILITSWKKFFFENYSAEFRSRIFIQVRIRLMEVWNRKLPKYLC